MIAEKGKFYVYSLDRGAGEGVCYIELVISPMIALARFSDSAGAIFPGRLLREYNPKQQEGLPEKEVRFAEGKLAAKVNAAPIKQDDGRTYYENKGSIGENTSAGSGHRIWNYE